MSDILKQSKLDRDRIKFALNEARKHGLEVEVVYDALLTMKEDNSLTISDTIIEGFYEWVK